MKCIASTPGDSGYRFGCHCTVCRAGHAKRQREYRAAARERARIAQLEENAQAEALAAATPPDEQAPELALDPNAPAGPIERAFTADFGTLVGEPPWKETLGALARANARIVDQAGRHQRLDVLSGVQLRMLDILDRLRKVPDGDGAHVPASWSAESLAEPD